MCQTFRSMKPNIFLTFKDRHLDSDHCEEMSPVPTIVPVNLTINAHRNQKLQQQHDLQITQEKGMNSEPSFRRIFSFKPHPETHTH